MSKSIEQAMTTRQRKFINAVAADKGLNKETMHRLCFALLDTEFDDLDRRQASQFIEALHQYDATTATTAGR